MEDLRKLGTGAISHAQPVREILAKVVAKEGAHSEGVMHYYFAWKKK